MMGVMRLARIAHTEGICFAIIEKSDDGSLIAKEISGTPFTPPEPTGREWPVDDVRLLSPSLPTKVVALGRNYADHVEEVFKQSSDSLPPTFFLKPSSAVVGPGAAIKIPDFAKKVEFEGELAVIIKKVSKNIRAENWRDHVLGYTICNDVSSRELQHSDGQWTRGKGIDTFCPLGPWIETDLDPQSVDIVTTLDGEVAQDGHSSDMVHGVAELVSYASKAFTLLPGDVILTGTPAGVGRVVAGQRVEVEIAQIGTLSNPFVAAED